MATFRDLERAAYCPRQYYYHDGAEEVPEQITRRRAIAGEYDRLLADRGAREAAPLAVDPARWLDRMTAARDRLDRFEELLDPPETDVYVAGERARGVIAKVLTEPPAPVLVSAGRPPERGVYDPQAVRATAAADALGDREGRAVERAIVEYPAYGEIRSIAIDRRRRGRYRSVRQTIASIEGPPPRIDNTAKCEACEFEERCGTPTRSVRSLLGL